MFRNMNKNNTRKNNNETEQRIAKIEQEIRDKGGITGNPGGLSQSDHLAFLEYCQKMDAMLEGEGGIQIDLEDEIKSRINPPSDPGVLSDEEVRKHLNSMIELLARFHCKLESTDHMTDRELYLKILDDVIKEPLLIPDDLDGVLYYHECCPGEDVDQYMRYYADEDEREEYYRESGERLPPKAPLKAHRDDWIQSLAEKHRNQPLPTPKRGNT